MSESTSPIAQRVQSSSSSSSSSSIDTRGKHRIQAEVKRLEQEARILEVSPFLLFRLRVLIVCDFECLVLNYHFMNV